MARKRASPSTTSREPPKVLATCVYCKRSGLLGSEISVYSVAPKQFVDAHSVCFWRAREAREVRQP